MQWDQHFNRVQHEVLHELAHLLFNEGEGGAFRAALNKRIVDTKLQDEIEESIVRKAGVRLALPDHHVTASISGADSLVAAAVALAWTCRTSFSLAVRHVLQRQDRSVRGMIIDGAGKAVDGFGHGSPWAEKYAPRPGHLIPEHHELRNLPRHDQTVRLRCPIPFKGSPRREMSDAEAYHDSRRHQTIVLFHKFKQRAETMPSLFDSDAFSDPQTP